MNYPTTTCCSKYSMLRNFTDIKAKKYYSNILLTFLGNGNIKVTIVRGFYATACNLAYANIPKVGTCNKQRIH